MSRPVETDFMLPQRTLKSKPVNRLGEMNETFDTETTIRYSVKDASPVNIGIYNVKGQLVKTLVNEEKASGNHSIVWDGRDNNNHAVSSGVYFYKMTAGKYSSTKKMIMMK